MSEFKLTYSTMFSPPRELHDSFIKAVDNLQFNKDYSLFINGKWISKDKKLALKNPADQSHVLGNFSLADISDVDDAICAAKAASRAWKMTPWQERVKLMHKVADIIERRVYEISAAVSFEVGKNRMEAIGETAEVVDFFNLYADDMEKNKGFDHRLPDDPLPNFKSHNRSIMKPYGVWAVIAPFNFPFALSGGPTAAALVTGNTVILKGSLNTPWAGVFLAQCIQEAGVPDGVFNYIIGSGSSVGEHLISHDDIDGVTFTGSYVAGMHISQKQINRPYPRPCITEMGGKNAVIVTQKADIKEAAQGIVRSSFGLSGQKCSALSRIYVDKEIASTLVEEILSLMRNIKLANPQMEDTWMGPVTTKNSFENYQKFSELLSQQGSEILFGGKTRPDIGDGFFCEPTLAKSPLSHLLWEQEMFLPIVMLAEVKDREEALTLANNTNFGLTAGFYGGDDEVDWFFENIEAGVTYANRPQGATTGSWPGYQPFCGWKGSGSTGKAIASFYYLAYYMREQSQTLVE